MNYVSTLPDTYSKVVLYQQLESALEDIRDELVMNLRPMIKWATIGEFSQSHDLTQEELFQGILAQKQVSTLYTAVLR